MRWRHTRNVRDVKSMKRTLPPNGNAKSARLVPYLQPFVTLTRSIVLISGNANMRNMRKAKLYEMIHVRCIIYFPTNGNVIFLYMRPKWMYTLPFTSPICPTNVKSVK